MIVPIPGPYGVLRGALESLLVDISSVGWYQSRRDSQLYQNLPAIPRMVCWVCKTCRICALNCSLHIHAPQITSVVPLMVPLDSEDSIEAPTYISENWAVLACVGAADAALQLDLSQVGVFVTRNHMPPGQTAQPGHQHLRCPRCSSGTL